MAKVIEGHLTAKGKRFAIVASRFNDFITKKLLEGALDAISRHGGDEKQVSVVWVPGSFEIPLVASKLATGKKFDAVICLGTVIRGSTPHFDYIASEVAKGVAHINVSTGVPVSFGIITADSLEQAIERAGTKQGNKGADAALSAIEMANVVAQL